MKAKVRLHIVQALYQKEITGTPLERLLEDYRYLQKILAQPEIYQHFKAVLQNVSANEKEFDQKIASFLSSDWTLQRLDKILLIILRAGIAEKKEEYMLLDYVEIAHLFLASKAAAMANAILDKIMHEECRE